MENSRQAQVPLSQRTQGCCFFCLRPTGSSFTTEGTWKEVSLRHIFDYLGVHVCQSLNDYLAQIFPGTNLSRQEEAEVNEAKFSLCHQCVQMVAQFSEFAEKEKAFVERKEKVIDSLSNQILRANADKTVMKNYSSLVWRDGKVSADYWLVKRLRELIVECWGNMKLKEKNVAEDFAQLSIPDFEKSEEANLNFGQQPIPNMALSGTVNSPVEKKLVFPQDPIKGKQRIDHLIKVQNEGKAENKKSAEFPETSAEKEPEWISKVSPPPQFRDSDFNGKLLTSATPSLTKPQTKDRIPKTKLKPPAHFMKFYRVIQGPKPYQCRVCGEDFAFQSQFHNHFEEKHENTPRDPRNLADPENRDRGRESCLNCSRKITRDSLFLSGDRKNSRSCERGKPEEKKIRLPVERLLKTPVNVCRK